MNENRPPVNLSEDDWRVLGPVIDGLWDSDIAAVLGWTEARVKSEISQLTQRLGASDRLDLTLLALDLRPQREANNPAGRKPIARAEGEPGAEQTLAGGGGHWPPTEENVVKASDLG